MLACGHAAERPRDRDHRASEIPDRVEVQASSSPHRHWRIYGPEPGTSAHVFAILCIVLLSAESPAFQICPSLNEHTGLAADRYWAGLAT